MPPDDPDPDDRNPNAPGHRHRYGRENHEG